MSAEPPWPKKDLAACKTQLASSGVLLPRATRQHQASAVAFCQGAQEFADPRGLFGSASSDHLHSSNSRPAPAGWPRTMQLQ